MHIGSRIKDKLQEQGKTVQWLATELFCSRTNVYKIFGKEHIDSKTLLKISELLKHDFFAEYSKELKKELNNTKA